MSQSDRLLTLLSDLKWHCTSEILSVVYGSEHAGIARIGARIKDLKDKGAEIDGKRDPNKPSLYWYRLIRPPVEPSPKVLPIGSGRVCEKARQGDLFPQNHYD